MNIRSITLLGEPQIDLGLDIIAVPGTVKEEPLTARILAIPGLKAGEPTQFNCIYFTDTRAFSLSGPGVSNLLSFETGVRIKMTRLRKPVA